MGFAAGRIIFDRENYTYHVADEGEAVQGKVIFDLGKLTKFRGIYLSITGFCRVHWTTNHTRREEGQREDYTKTHESYEEYLNQKIYLFGGSQGEYSLNPGHYEYPFACALPPKLPSSFEGSSGHVRYEVKTVMEQPFKSDEQIYTLIKVIAPCDLNKIRHAKKPIELEIYKSYCCWCMNYGSSEVVVKVPASGFCVGQKIPIELACTNTSRVEIKGIRFTVNRNTEYRATTEPETKKDVNKIAEMYVGPVPPQCSRNWSELLDVPHLTAYNLTTCRFIKLDYDLQVTVEVAGCHENTSESHRIYFGSAPISGPVITSATENLHNVINSTQTPYPGNTPFQGNSAYPYPSPMVNPQFPTIAPSLPQPTAPHPGAFAYPGVSYPGPNPSYPVGANPASAPMGYPANH